MVNELIKWALAHIAILLACVAILAALAVAFRGRLKRMMRLAKAAATDARLPKPVRGLFIVGLAAKAMPVDFGIDEFCLGLGVLLLATRYRSVWAEIREDVQ